jgi:hypothetical protein
MHRRLCVRALVLGSNGSQKRSFVTIPYFQMHHTIVQPKTLEAIEGQMYKAFSPLQLQKKFWPPAHSKVWQTFTSVDLDHDYVLHIIPKEITPKLRMMDAHLRLDRGWCIHANGESLQQRDTNQEIFLKTGSFVTNYVTYPVNGLTKVVVSSLKLGNVPECLSKYLSYLNELPQWARAQSLSCSLGCTDSPSSSITGIYINGSGQQMHKMQRWLVGSQRIDTCGTEQYSSVVCSSAFLDLTGKEVTQNELEVTFEKNGSLMTSTEARGAYYSFRKFVQDHAPSFGGKSSFFNPPPFD